MRIRAKFATAIGMLLLIAGSSAMAVAKEGQSDAMARGVLQRMGAYTGSLDQLVVKGEAFADARLDAGLIVSNSVDLVIKIDRPSSIYVESFDGMNTKKIYIHEGNLTVFNSENKFYARAKVPKDIEDAMQFAMEEFDLDMPLGELFFADSALALITEQDTVLYLTDKSRIGGADCHQIVVRGPEVDLQIWVEEGDRPTPRKIAMSMKWEAGSPRHVALLEWSGATVIDPGVFVFKAPEGAQEIKFVGSE